MIILRFSVKAFFLLLLLVQFTQEVVSQITLDFEKPLVKCWQVNLENTLEYKFASDNDNRNQLYLFRNDGFLQSFDVDTKNELWNSFLGGSLKDFAINEKQILLLISDKSGNSIKIKSLNKTSGIVNWESSIDFDKISRNVFFNSSLVLLSDETRLFAFNEISREVIWSNQNSNGLNLEPIVMSDEVIVIFGRTLKTISSNNGEILREISFDEDISAITIKDETIFLGDNKGLVFKLDLRTGEKNLEYRTGGKVSFIAETPEGLLISSFDNFIYFFSDNGSKLLWKERTPSRNVLSPVIFGKYVISPNFGTNSSNIYKLKNGKSINKITIEEDNLFVGRPIISDREIIFPTLRGIYIFKNQCQ